MQKYCETKGNPPFDWNKFLNQDSFTERELEEAHRLSSDWITCACGNQCAILDRDYSGAPIDLSLNNLGFNFYGAIGQLRWGDNKYERLMALKEAKTILAKIEERSAQLIQEKYNKMYKSKQRRKALLAKIKTKHHEEILRNQRTREVQLV